ncbi:unnamed protein product [Lathyrus sativus]|nr:unnamed protein product [Lathyrus sativus]
MSILVSRSLTKDFKVGRGLRQRDPLSPFFFVIITEYLSELLKIASVRGDFKGFSVQEGLSTDIIQFVNDTFIVGSGCIQFVNDTFIVGSGCGKNLWSIKAILRGFELVSGLGVNYHKSRSININVSNYFLLAISNFLVCKLQDPNFNFLRIPTGSNMRRINLWSYIIDNFKSKLALWRGRFLSFGGRITLINAVLSSLPIFIFSFYKAPVKVLKKVDKILQRFICGGSDEK